MAAADQAKRGCAGDGKEGGRKLNIHLLSAHGNDALAWNGYLARLPGADIYHTPEYHRAHEANGDGTALCFVAEDEENVLLHPFILREIPGTAYRDIETVYGYSGPLATGQPIRLMANYRRDNHPIYQGPIISEPFLATAWHLWADQCRTMGVVAEFTRFNPLSGNERYRGLSELVLDRETVVLDLTGSEADLMARYTKTHRNMIRKALAHGLVSWELSTAREIPPGFVKLYDRTMQRCGADDYYHFPPAYFDALRQGLGERLLLLGVQAGDRLTAAGLFMLHGDRMHYHLSGSDPDSPGYGDNNLLLHHAALWGQQQGYRWLHLGGGRTADPGDSLLRFKASISRERRPFYVGRRVHNQAAYDALCRDWMARHGVTESLNYFLLWRKP